MKYFFPIAKNFNASGCTAYRDWKDSERLIRLKCNAKGSEVPAMRENVVSYCHRRVGLLYQG